MYLDPTFIDTLKTIALQARIGWAAAFVSLALLTVFALRLGARYEMRRRESIRQRLGRLHHGQEATASMEYLLVLFPFLIIVMTVWQLAFMLNARLHVGYSTFAAARSAAVLIPMKTADEKVGELKPLGNSNSSKWRRIRRAAIPGTIAISPGNAEEAVAVAASHAISGALTGGGSFSPPQAPDAAMAARLTLMSMHMCSTPIFCKPVALTEGTRWSRAGVKDYYAQNMTTVFINNKDHKQNQNFAGQLDANGGENGGEQDAISVRVEYIFYLNVPWVGRMLEAAIEGFGAPGTGQMSLELYPSVRLFQETAINTWFRKRATEPCP